MTKKNKIIEPYQGCYRSSTAASEQNKLCKYFYTSKENALLQSWNRNGGAVFCNPPYGKSLLVWVKKGVTEALTHNITVVMLIPAKPDIQLFHRYIWDKTKGKFRENVEVRFIERRLKFFLNGIRRKDPATFPSMVVIFRPRQNSITTEQNHDTHKMRDEMKDVVAAATVNTASEWQQMTLFETRRSS